MKNLKVGDRVRINFPVPGYPLHGKEGTIWKISVGGWVNNLGRSEDLIAYSVDVDGHGRRGILNPGELAFADYELIPLVPPDELAWQEFREHLKPNPLVIFDADPIIVSTDEEAARIAETVPNSHIKVVIRGVLVSEYYGRSTTNQPEGK